MDRFLPLIYFLGWFCAIFGASYLINWLLIRSIIRNYYRWFVAPGVIVHELSHAIGCLITNSEITEINFWKASGGHVKHLQSTNPLTRFVSDPTIALAPIWGTFLLLGFLTWLMMPSLLQALSSNDYNLVLASFNFGSWHTWLYFYLTTSLMATIAPSKTDMKYALGSLVVVALVLVFIVLIPGVSNILLNTEVAIAPYAIFTLLLLVVGIIVSFILALPYRNKHFIPREQLD